MESVYVRIHREIELFTDPRSPSQIHLDSTPDHDEIQAHGPIPHRRHRSGHWTPAPVPRDFAPHNWGIIPPGQRLRAQPFHRPADLVCLGPDLRRDQLDSLGGYNPLLSLAIYAQLAGGADAQIKYLEKHR